MNNDRKILFFDIDGTLITDDGKRTFPEDAKEAIRKARANGHLLFINSGRVISNIEDFIKEGFDGIVCGCGTMIVYNGQILHHHELDQEYCKRIARKCREYGFAAIFEHADKTCFDKELDMDKYPGRTRILDYFSTMGRELVSDIESEDFIFDKFAAWYAEDSDMDGFMELIKDDFEYIDREDSFCEIVPKGYSKATGIKFLLDYFSISIDNAYVFGDSNNDIEMMSYVKNSIAMGKCSDRVRELATYVTDKVEDSGIKNAMIHFGLI